MLSDTVNTHWMFEMKIDILSVWHQAFKIHLFLNKMNTMNKAENGIILLTYAIV